MFKPAGPAEIVRSHQKDNFYINYLHGLTADVIHNFVGPRTWIKWRKEVDVLADLGYFLLTTVSGYQTIGEEYVNIIQTDKSQRKLPSVVRRTVMVLLHVLGPYCVRQILEWLEKRLRSPDSREIPLTTREFLLRCIPVVRTCVLFFHRFHMAVFYLTNIFYHIAKRTTGIHYIQYNFGGPQRPDHSIMYSFKMLGWVSLVQLAGSGLLATIRYIRNRSKKSAGSSIKIDSEDGDGGMVSADRKCSLCLEERKITSATPCGHLFCWACIHDWCQNKPECPLCREKFEQHRIILLQNFDPH